MPKERLRQRKRLVVRGPCSVVRGPWSVVCGLWSVVLWSVVLWSVVLWSVVLFVDDSPNRDGTGGLRRFPPGHQSASRQPRPAGSGLLGHSPVRRADAGPRAVPQRGVAVQELAAADPAAQAPGPIASGRDARARRKTCALRRRLPATATAAGLLACRRHAPEPLARGGCGGPPAGSDLQPELRPGSAASGPGPTMNP